MPEDQPEARHPAGSALLAACLCAVLLTGCAPTVRPVTTVPVAAVAGTATAGTVAAVREVDIAPGAGSRAGVDAVLAALGQPASPGNVSLQEIVIDQPDGAAVSLAGAYPGFTAGARVTIVEGQATTLAHGD